MKPRPLLALLLVAAALAPLAGAAGAGEPKWRVVVFGKAVGLGVSGGGDHVYVLDQEGFVHVIDSDGRDKLIRRIAWPAIDRSGNPVFASPRLGDGVLVGEAIDGGSLLTYYNSEGMAEWSIVVKGELVAYSLGPKGRILAVARKLQTGSPAERSVSLEVYRGGRLLGDTIIPVGSETNLTLVRLAASSSGLVAAYSPRLAAIILFDPSTGSARTLRLHGPASMLVISAGGERVACCIARPGGCTLRVYEGSKPVWEAELAGPPLAWDPDLRYFAVAEPGRIDVLGPEGNWSVPAAKPVFAGLSRGASYLLVGEEYTIQVFSSGGRQVLGAVALSRLERGVMSASGKAIVVADEQGRVYYYPNPSEERLELLVRLLALVAALLAGTLALIRLASPRRPRQAEPEDEEIFPPE